MSDRIYPPRVPAEVGRPCRRGRRDSLFLDQRDCPGRRLQAGQAGAGRHRRGGRGTEIGEQARQLANVVACADVERGNAERFAGAGRGQVRGL